MIDFFRDGLHPDEGDAAKAGKNGSKTAILERKLVDCIFLTIQKKKNENP